MGGKIAAALASLRLFGLEKLILIAPSPPTPEPIICVLLTPHGMDGLRKAARKIFLCK
jgi:pimeloyl-ACP methyl ester carboxylesterase